MALNGWSHPHGKTGSEVVPSTWQRTSTRVGFICRSMIVVTRGTTPLIGWPRRYDASDSSAE